MPKVSPIENFISTTVSPLGCQSPSLSPLKLRKGVNCGIDDRIMDGLQNRISKQNETLNTISHKSRNAIGYIDPTNPTKGELLSNTNDPIHKA